MAQDKKYVFVLVHADLWGAQTANKLMPAIAARGITPILIVSRASRREDGRHITPIVDFQLTRTIKEDLFNDYINSVDALPADKYCTPELLSFNRLAAKYSNGELPHFTTRGGPKGGEEVEKIIDELAAKKHRARGDAFRRYDGNSTCIVIESA